MTLIRIVCYIILLSFIFKLYVFLSSITFFVFSIAFIVVGELLWRFVKSVMYILRIKKEGGSNGAGSA
jgi:hypothetical protein